MESGEASGDALTARFEALRERLLGTAWYVIGGRTADREDAREAVQEAFLRCWRARGSHPAEAGLHRGATRAAVGGPDAAHEVQDLDAWVFAVLLNVARDVRRRRVVRRVETLPPEDAMRPAPQDDPARRVEAEDDLVRVRAAIRELPEGEREVFLLRQNGELPYETIAGALGIPVGTAKTRMRRALLRLRAAVEPSFAQTSPR